MGKSEPRTWGVTFDGGWQGALTLMPPEKDGLKRGMFFWLVQERDIRWDEDADTIAVIYRRPWNPLDQNPPKLRFKKDAESLVPLAEGLDAEEFKALIAKPWKSGGPEPGQLANSSDRSSPYSKAHDRTELALDVSTIPVSLARHALRVFDDDLEHLLPMIHHPGFSSETLNTIWKDANETWKEHEHDSRRRSIMMALARNPSIPKDLLGTLWNDASQLKPQNEGLFYLVSRHPSADPEWYAAVLKQLAGDDEKSDRLRASLSSYYPLPVEVLDLLVRNASSAHHDSSLAFRKDLTALQIEALFLLGLSDSNKELVARADFPTHLFEKAAASESKEVLEALAKNPVAPPEIVQQVLRSIYANPYFPHSWGAFSGLVFLAGHPLLPADLQTKLAAHIAPEVREALAGNPSLVPSIRKQLASDPYACVAKAARASLEPDKDYAAFLTSLPALKSLKPEGNFNQAYKAVLKVDDPDALRLYISALVGTPHGPDYLSAIKLGAIRCLRDQMESGNLNRKILATYAFSEGWTKDMTDLALGKDPDPEIVELFALSIAQKGKAEDFGILEKRHLDLKFVSKSPLAWFAVARRDVDMLKRLTSLHADLSIPNDGLTPSQLAVRTRFMDALETLPLDVASRSELDAFQKRFPGNSKAPWLGLWTNGKGEFKTLVLQFNSDGTGVLVTAIGTGIPIAWVEPEPGHPKFDIITFDERGKEQQPLLKARLDGSKLILKIGDNDESFNRPQQKE